ncbi:unnamed protein product, partial [Rotaria sp. Silwood1]
MIHFDCLSCGILSDQYTTATKLTTIGPITPPTTPTKTTVIGTTSITTAAKSTTTTTTQ